MQNNLSIRDFVEEDIPFIVEAFTKANWPKPIKIFEAYFNEQLQGKRLVWVAYIEKQLAGYVTLTWHSRYKQFALKKIPEIMDLNVLPQFRGIGIGSKLLNIAEKEASTKSNIIGVGVGLYGGNDGGYGPAQIMYIKHGYIPDGSGVTYKYNHAIPGNNFPLDDDLVLWLRKCL